MSNTKDIMKTFPTIYKRDKTQKINQWTVVADGAGYYTVEGAMGGKLSTSQPNICEAKSIGKKNATTAAEQALKEAQAKFDHKLEHGYSRTLEGVDDTGFIEPMLAKKYDDYKEGIKFPVYVDNKLNGVRCNIRKNQIMSRQNKPFRSIPHIVTVLTQLFKKYPKLYLDGELFNPKLKNHLNRLIECVSVGYKDSDLTPELLKESESIVQFHCYDGYGFEGITAETPFVERRKALQKLLKGIDHVYVLGYDICEDDIAVQALLKKADMNKDEGIIIRHGDCPYEHKRSKYLLKAKNFVDDEFEIEEVQEGSGNWAGYAKRIVLKLHKPTKDRNGKVMINFASNIEGNQDYLRKLLHNKEEAVGKMATVKFLGYSEYKVPQIPYITAIRDYE